MMTDGEDASHPSTFRDFEHAGWEGIPVQYDHGFAELTSQSVRPLLDGANVGRGTRVLDVATGPGYIAAAAASRGAQVVGVDFSAAMIDHARRRTPHVEFREGDAEALPFPVHSFDAVIIGFGLLHLSNPDRALEEAHRVLAPGGRCAFTVWAPPEETVGFGIVLRAVEAHGRTDVPLPPGPPFFRFSDPEECVRSMEAAGFEGTEVTRLPQTWRLPSPEALFEVMLGGTVRTAGLLRSQSPEALIAIREAMREEAARYRTEEGAVELPMPAVLGCSAAPPAGDSSPSHNP